MAKKGPGPLAHGCTATPRNITPAIEAFCKSLNAVGRPLYVPVKHWPSAEKDWCLDNTKLFVAKHQSQGHSIENGWNIWETPGIWLEAEAHSIIRKKDGTLLDINPHPYGDRRILFLPDSFTNATWEGRMVGNHYHPLVDDLRLLELIEAKRKVAEFRGRFPFGSVVVSVKALELAKKQAPNVHFIPLSESDDLEYRGLDQKVKKLEAELNL